MIHNLFSREIKVTKKKPTILFLFFPFFFTFFREFKVVNMFWIFSIVGNFCRKIAKDEKNLTKQCRSHLNLTEIFKILISLFRSL